MALRVTPSARRCRWQRCLLLHPTRAGPATAAARHGPRGRLLPPAYVDGFARRCSSCRDESCGDAVCGIAALLQPFGPDALVWQVLRRPFRERLTERRRVGVATALRGHV